MRIWTTVMGQRLEDAENTRSMLLCDYLMRRGHQVTMWTSAWDHIHKEWRKEWLASKDGVWRRDDGLEIRFMKGCGYTQNTSPRRLVDHWIAAADFTRQARELARAGETRLRWLLRERQASPALSMSATNGLIFCST